jgi:hypothetical protein
VVLVRNDIISEFMSITIDLSPETVRYLELRAQRVGEDVKKVVEQIVERSVPSLREIAAPIHEEFRRSGMTQDDLDEFTDELIAEVRREKPLASR